MDEPDADRELEKLKIDVGSQSAGRVGPLAKP